MGAYTQRNNIVGSTVSFHTPFSGPSGTEIQN